jgi:glycerol-3-phosphate O-acyltransferase 3/4
MEAIIEDEVTSRFEAEELKNWNLLTRTNRHYEFISWRLTVIWVIGFFIRYFLLMPLRVLICFVGVSIRPIVVQIQFKLFPQFCCCPRTTKQFMIIFVTIY